MQKWVLVFKRKTLLNPSMIHFNKTVFFLSVSQWVVLKDSLLHWFQWNNNLEICLPLTHICFSGFLGYNFSISWVKKMWTPWPWLKSAVYCFSISTMADIGANRLWSITNNKRWKKFAKLYFFNKTNMMLPKQILNHMTMYLN